jgi:hypothetical protein
MGDGRVRRTVALTLRFRARGGAAPAPLGWLSRRRGICRQLHAATAEITGALSMHDLLAGAPPAVWRAWTTAAGRALARWHQAGLLHPDLNLGNILARQPAGTPPVPEDLVVIDLDGARLRQRVGRAGRARALARLERSARKLFGPQALPRRRRLRLLAAYGRQWAELECRPPQAGDPLLRRLLPALRWRRWLFVLHRRGTGRQQA